MRTRARNAMIAGVVVALVATAGCGGSANECAACMEEKCADLFDTCAADPACACMAECLGNDGVPGVSACMATCSVSARPAGFAALELCVATACPDSEDECSTPANYTPPEAATCEPTGADIGSGAEADCGFDLDLAHDPDGAVLQLQSADASICLRLERRNDGAGTLANTQWTLTAVRVGPLGEVAVIDDAAQLCWYSSHHNFRDVLHARTDTRHYDLLLLEDGHGGPRVYELYVFDDAPVSSVACAASIEDANCIEGPIRLVPFAP